MIIKKSAEKDLRNVKQLIADHVGDHLVGGLK